MIHLLGVLVLLLFSFHVHSQDQEEGRDLILALTGEYGRLRSPLLIWNGDLVFATTSRLRPSSPGDIFPLPEERIYWHRYDFETRQLETGDANAPFLTHPPIDETLLAELNVNRLDETNDSLYDMVSLSPDGRYLLYVEATSQTFWLMDFEMEIATDLEVSFRGAPATDSYGKLFYLDTYWDLERGWLYFQRYTPIAYAVTIPAVRVSLDTKDLEELHLIPTFREAFSGGVTRPELITMHTEYGHLLAFADYPVNDYWFYNMTTETFTHFETPYPVGVAAVWLDENTLRLTVRGGVVDYDVASDTYTFVRFIELFHPEYLALKAVFSEDGRYFAAVSTAAPELDGEPGIFLYELPALDG